MAWQEREKIACRCLSFHDRNWYEFPHETTRSIWSNKNGVHVEIHSLEQIERRIPQKKSKKILYLRWLNKLHEQGLGYQIFFFRLTIQRLSPWENATIDGSGCFVWFRSWGRLVTRLPPEMKRHFPVGMLTQRYIHIFKPTLVNNMPRASYTFPVNHHQWQQY